MSILAPVRDFSKEGDKQQSVNFVQGKYSEYTA